MTTDLAGLALAEVGQSYPAACQAAAAAGYDGLEPAANGVRAVLAGEASLFRCRYHAPYGTRPYEVTVTPLAEGDGAVVTSVESDPPLHGARTAGSQQPDPPLHGAPTGRVAASEKRRERLSTPQRDRPHPPA